MRIEVRTVTEETYTFTPNDGTEEVHILSGRLRKWLHAKAMNKVIDLTFPEQPLEEIVVQHGLEAPRMASMTEAEAQEPVIVGLWPGGTHILIDGGPPPLVLGQARGEHPERVGCSLRGLVDFHVSTERNGCLSWA